VAQVDTWAGAKRYCNELVLGGCTGWRLPSRIELVSISDFTRTDPSIDDTVFPDTTVERPFWTSSIVAGQSSPGPTIWALTFAQFFFTRTTSEDVLAVRCVRDPTSGSAAPPERYIIANGTIYDTKTKLTWQQVAGPNTGEVVWFGAQVCPSLMLDGGGWRLPSLTELMTLIDESRSSPAIDPTAFPDTPSEFFVTSTLVDGHSDLVDFKTGDAGAVGGGRIRCVR
jgi:hypothetical protein